MLTVDVRGFSCPEPVIQVKNALGMLKDSDQLEVLVETVTSRENIRRMARTKGYTVEVQDTDDGFRLIITQS